MKGKKQRRRRKAAYARPTPTFLHRVLILQGQRPTECRPKQPETLFLKLTYPFPREMSTGLSSSMSTRKALFMFW